MEMTDLRTSIWQAERALAAVESNGIEYIHTHEGNYPCGGCRTYQTAVHQALRILRSLDLDEPASQTGGNV